MLRTATQTVDVNEAVGLAHVGLGPNHVVDTMCGAVMGGPGDAGSCGGAG